MRIFNLGRASGSGRDLRALLHLLLSYEGRICGVKVALRDYQAKGAPCFLKTSFNQVIEITGKIRYTKNITIGGLFYCRVFLIKKNGRGGNEMKKQYLFYWFVCSSCRLPTSAWGFFSPAVSEGHGVVNALIVSDSNSKLGGIRFH